MSGCSWDCFCASCGLDQACESAGGSSAAFAERSMQALTQDVAAISCVEVERAIAVASVHVDDSDEDDGSGSRKSDGGQALEQAGGERVCNDADFFDMLAERPQGPRRFTKRAPEPPTCVYAAEGGGGQLYVGGFRAAEDWSWLAEHRVGLVVSVLGSSQQMPRVPRGVVALHFDSGGFEVAQQWRSFASAVKTCFDAGGCVLVHCMAGVHRAPMCAAGGLAVLLQSFERRVSAAGMKRIVDAVASVRFELRGGDAGKGGKRDNVIGTGECVFGGEAVVEIGEVEERGKVVGAWNVGEQIGAVVAVRGSGMFGRGRWRSRNAPTQQCVHASAVEGDGSIGSEAGDGDGGQGEAQAPADVMVRNRSSGVSCSRRKCGRTWRARRRRARTAAAARLYGLENRGASVAVSVCTLGGDVVEVDLAVEQPEMLCQELCVAGALLLETLPSRVGLVWNEVVLCQQDFSSARALLAAVDGNRVVFAHADEEVMRLRVLRHAVHVWQANVGVMPPLVDSSSSSSIGIGSDVGVPSDDEGSSVASSSVYGTDLRAFFGAAVFPVAEGENCDGEGGGSDQGDGRCEAGMFDFAAFPAVDLDAEVCRADVSDASGMDRDAGGGVLVWLIAEDTVDSAIVSLGNQVSRDTGHAGEDIGAAWSVDVDENDGADDGSGGGDGGDGGDGGGWWRWCGRQGWRWWRWSE